jgi:hypothetical protein
MDWLEAIWTGWLEAGSMQSGWAGWLVAGDDLDWLTERWR